MWFKLIIIIILSKHLWLQGIIPNTNNLQLFGIKYSFHLVWFLCISGVVVYSRVPSTGQKELFNHLTVCIIWH